MQLIFIYIICKSKFYFLGLLYSICKMQNMKMIEINLKLPAKLSSTEVYLAERHSDN